MKIVFPITSRIGDITGPPFLFKNSCICCWWIWFFNLIFQPATERNIPSLHQGNPCFYWLFTSTDHASMIFLLMQQAKNKDSSLHNVNEFSFFLSGKADGLSSSSGVRKSTFHTRKGRDASWFTLGFFVLGGVMKWRPDFRNLESQLIFVTGDDSAVVFMWNPPLQIINTLQKRSMFLHTQNRPETFLCGVCMFPLCLDGFSPASLASWHSPKTCT